MAIAVARPGHRGRPGFSLPAGAPIVAGGILLVGAALFLLLGGRALVVLSGSMEPALRTGDIAVTRTVHPDEVSVSDIVTFTDPSREDALVTHRVVRVARAEDRYAFVTKGDANGAVEQWTIASDGTMGVLIFRIPKVGFLLRWIGNVWLRTACLIGGGLILTAAALRRIWGR